MQLLKSNVQQIEWRRSKVLELRSEPTIKLKDSEQIDDKEAKYENGTSNCNGFNQKNNACAWGSNQFRHVTVTRSQVTLITGVGVCTVIFGSALTSKVAVPTADGGIEILFDIKFEVIFSVELLVIKNASD